MLEFGYIFSPCEFITVKLCQAIDSCHASDIAIVIPDDATFVAEHGRQPMKSLEDRMLLASSIKRVNYVCEIVGEDTFNRILPVADEVSSKRFKVGYVPGTFDLVHPGHLELVDIARSQCETVIVGVNSDEQVWKNKQKHPRQNERTRMYIMQHLRGVDGVILVETNDQTVANQKVMNMTGHKIDAIFYGQDLAGKAINDEGGLECESIYTPRSEEKMKKVSTTAAIKSLDEILRSYKALQTENEYLKSILQQID